MIENRRVLYLSHLLVVTDLNLEMQGFIRIRITSYNVCYTKLLRVAIVVLALGVLGAGVAFAQGEQPPQPYGFGMMGA